MNPQDALEAIFEQISLIFVKLCEITPILLSIDADQRLFGSNGNVINQSVTFDNLDTEPNTDVQAIITTQVSDFNSFISQLITSKRALLPAANQGFSDCKVLKICSKLNTINGLWSSAQNVADTPQKISQLLAQVISSIKVLFDRDNTITSQLKFQSNNLLLSQLGNFNTQTITFNNFDTEVDGNIELSISNSVNQFVVFLFNLVTTTISNNPDIPVGSTDCVVLNVCDKTTEINALWLQPQQLIDTPQKINNALVEAIFKIQTLLAQTEDIDPIIDFDVPALWTDKGRLNIDRASFGIKLTNPNNSSSIQEIENDINDIYEDIVKAININLGNTSSPFVP